MPHSAPKRDLLSIRDLEPDLLAVLERAHAMKSARRRGDRSATRPGTNAALIFEKPSTRTRTSFEVAMEDLGGHGLYMSSKDLQLGRGETIADTARVLSRYVDAIVYRAFRHTDMRELAKWASVPVINALDDREHPCQIVADLLTLYELWDGHFTGHTLLYVGDGNNVCNSLALGSAMVGLDFLAAVPTKYRPPKDVQEAAAALARAHGSKVTWGESPTTLAPEAEVLYTDVWVSMGDEADEKQRTADFQGYVIDEALLKSAKKGAKVMHDLPAHRGLEITDGVMDGPDTLIWDQAENRLHAQKAILERLIPESARRA
jgi:ornithine carbamoyltransferase